MTIGFSLSAYDLGLVFHVGDYSRMLELFKTPGMKERICSIVHGTAFDGLFELASVNYSFRKEHFQTLDAVLQINTDDIRQDLPWLQRSLSRLLPSTVPLPLRELLAQNSESRIARRFILILKAITTLPETDRFEPYVTNVFDVFLEIIRSKNVDLTFYLSPSSFDKERALFNELIENNTPSLRAAKRQRLPQHNNAIEIDKLFNSPEIENKLQEEKERVEGLSIITNEGNDNNDALTNRKRERVRT